MKLFADLSEAYIQIEDGRRHYLDCMTDALIADQYVATDERNLYTLCATIGCKGSIERA